MHPLDQLRLRLSGPKSGYILHRSIGQGHPGRVIQRQSWLTFEELPEHCRITVRGTVIVWFIQPLCKFRQGFLVLPQRITQMPQHLHDSHEHGCLAMLPSQSTNQLLLLSELQIGFCVLHIFFGKDGCKFLLKIASIQAGEGWCDLQKGDDLASGLLHLRQQRTSLSAARQTAREAAMRRDLLKQHLPEGPLPDSDAPLPQPAISREQLDTLLPQIAAQQQAARSRLDTLTGQLRSLDSADDLDAQLLQHRQQLQQLQEEYDAVALAMEVLDEANATLQNRFSPALGAQAAEIFAKITKGRYQKVLLSRDFALETDSEGAQRSVQLLSQGAADQLYLAVRLAICDLVLPEEKHVPLILDDALLSFDDDRLHAALDYLLEESESRQILLFTCQKRESAYLDGRKNVTITHL